MRISRFQWVLAVTISVLGCLSVIGCSKVLPPNKAIQQPVSAGTYKNEETVPTAADVDSGLLLGLALDGEEGQDYDPMDRIPDQHRTLWIYQNNGQLTYMVKPGSIIAPYKDRFWKIEYSNFTMSEPNDMAAKDAVSVFEKFSSYYNFKNIISHLADEPGKDLFSKASFTKQFLNGPEGSVDSFKSDTEWLLFAGNHYACLLDYDFETGGGTLHFSNNEIVLYNIDDLASFETRNKPVRLLDLLDSNSRQKLAGYEQKYDKTLEKTEYSSLKQSVDINNFALFRSNGRWHLKIPLYNNYEHYGNGSTEHYLTDYIDTDISLPATFTGYDALCVEWPVIKKKYPQAKDAVSSPTKDMLAVLTPTSLLVFSHPENGLDKPSLVIPVSGREKIILNQWATGKNVDKWAGLMRNY